jgi:polyhydroxyalkanoate synthesis regulator phasin
VTTRNDDLAGRNGAGVLWSRARFAALLTVAALIGGCDSPMPNDDQVETLNVGVEFVGTRPIESGAAITINGLVIGRVAKVEHRQDQTRLTLALDRDKAGVVQSNGAAGIDPVNHHIVIYNGETKSGAVVDGASLIALNSPLDEAAWQAGRALSVMQDSMRRFSTAMQGYFESEEWRQSKSRVEDDLRQFGEQSRQAAETVRDDVEAMLRNLESQSRQTTDEARRQLNALQETLQRLAQENSGEINSAITKLLDSLQSALDKATRQQQG